MYWNMPFKTSKYLLQVLDQESQTSKYELHVPNHVSKTSKKYLRHQVSQTS